MHNKQNNRERKTYVQGLRAFGNTLPRGIRGILKKNGYNYSEIINKWKFLVGKDISNLCYPKSIKMTKSEKNGTLILSVQRGNEIIVEYSKKEIINKINSFFGYRLINVIKLQASNSEKMQNPKKKLTISSEKYIKKINEIKNKDIRSSLSQLINVIKND
jgi:hypothetical protein